jgi:hypothetical protein
MGTIWKVGEKHKVIRTEDTTYTDQYGYEHAAEKIVEEKIITITHKEPYIYYGQDAGPIWHAVDDSGEDHTIYPQIDYGPCTMSWVGNKIIWQKENYKAWNKPLLPMEKGDG